MNRMLKSILPLLLLSPAAAMADNAVGNIDSNHSIQRKGFGVPCLSALLIPRGPVADRNVQTVFGSLDDGSSALFSDSAMVSVRLPGTLEARCAPSHSSKGRHLFSDVPAGEYCVVLRFERSTNPHSQKVDESAFAGLQMRRAAVSGTTTKLRFN